MEPAITVFPEQLLSKLCGELGLAVEIQTISLTACAIHRKVLQHKKDAIKRGAIGGLSRIGGVGGGGGHAATDEKRDRSNFGLAKHKRVWGLGVVERRATSAAQRL